MREEKDLLLQEAILMKRYQTYLKDPLVIEVYLSTVYLYCTMKSPLLATLAGRFSAKSGSDAGVTGRFYLFCPHFTPPLFRAPKVYLSVTRGWFRRCGRCVTIQVFPQEIVEPPQAGLKKRGYLL